MSHPDPHALLDRTPIRNGEIWENPITGERATILERPDQAGCMARLVNATDHDARVRLEVTPGEHFIHMIETLFGLAGLATPTREVCRICCSKPCSLASSAM